LPYNVNISRKKASKATEKLKNLSSSHYVSQKMGDHNVVCNGIVFLSILTGHIPAKTNTKYMVGIPRYGFPSLNWDFLPDSPSDMAIKLMVILTG
jgi:hypothetical protein